MSDIINKVKNFSGTKSQQLDLFSTYFGNQEDHSNTIELWDHIPKYFVTEKEQVELRTKEGFLPILKRSFEIKNTHWTMEIQPALVSMTNGVEKAVYPGFSEELIEDALRKIFSQHESGLHEPIQAKSWVRFSLKEVQRELKKWGSTRSIDEIKLSLDIMAGCTVKLFRNDKELHSTQIITSLTSVDRQDYLENTHSRWVCRLPDLLTEAMSTGQYRQYNYALNIFTYKKRRKP